jgi:cytochrome b6-f complex iron-sulfur subunit/menaquinol-cytochrome c reductase iron-sulfur subunit
VGRAALGAGAALTAAIATPSVAMLLSPVLDRAEEGNAGWRTVGPAARFAVGAPPLRVQVTEDRQDKWLLRRDVPVGSVLVRRLAEAEFRVLSAKCPHLGCSVRVVEGEDAFQCPCHRSHFDGAGALLPHADGQPNPAPRGLDALAWRVADGALQIQWVEYKTGTAQQVPVS